MQFDSTHLTYIAIAVSFTIIILFLSSKIKKEKSKNFLLKVFAFGTFIIHISIIWFDFFTEETVTLSDNLLFPVYFCNLSMDMLVIASLIPNKQSKSFKLFATFAAYSGIIGSTIALIYPDAYIMYGTLADYGIFKGMLSHSVMLLGSLYLFVGGFVKIRVENVIYIVGGLAIGVIDGSLVNWFYVLAGKTPPNAMYLMRPPLADYPFLNCWVLAFIIILAAFIFTSIYEFFKFSKEERWYTKLKLTLENRKNKA